MSKEKRKEVTNEDQALAVIKEQSKEVGFLADEDFFEVIGRYDNIPYLNLVQRNSPQAEEHDPGTILLVTGSATINIGSELDAIVLANRHRASHFTDETMVNSFDHTSELFVEIDKKAKEGGLNGYMAGTEYLFWLPEHNTYACLFCASKTLKRFAREQLKAYHGEACTISSHLIQSKKHSWYGLTANKCTRTLKTTPDSEDLVSKIQMFKNPDTSQEPEPASTDNEER